MSMETDCGILVMEMEMEMEMEEIGGE